jgi:hypothetical protein
MSTPDYPTLRFGFLSVAKARVHQRTVTFSLRPSVEDQGEQVVRAHFNNSEQDSWGDSYWGRVFPDHCFKLGGNHTGSFCRENARDTLLQTIWLNSINYCPSTLCFWDPTWARGAAVREDGPWLTIRSAFQECIGLRFFGCILDYPHWLDVPSIFWPTALAYAQKYRSNPAFVIRRKDRPLDSVERIGPWDCRTLLSRIGPWAFTGRDDAYWPHYRKGPLDPESIDADQRETYELKRWLHGYKSKHDSTKEVMKQAVRRRIVKHRATQDDIQFFQTIFGAAQVARWLKEAGKKNTHEHNHTGKN